MSVCMFMLLSVGMALIGCNRDEPMTEKERSYKGTIVAAGDSLTAGFSVIETEAYPAQLQRKLNENGYAYQVINAGVSGETSSGMLSRINWILTLKPDIVVLETGANDSLRGTELAHTEKNIMEAVKILKSRGITVILAGMQTVQNLGNEYTSAFSAIYPAIAEKERIILIPFFLEGVAGNRDLNISDGIHPTAEGYRIIAESIYPYIIKGIREREGNRQHAFSPLTP